MPSIGRAILSVYDKTGLVPLARQLAHRGIALISTGGTARALREAGLVAQDISELTGFPEMLDGRVKTLHPKVHGGLLFRRDLAEHRAQAQGQGIEPIDLVVVNLYPFEATIARPGIAIAEAIEQIDIGGPSMLRSAAKNHDAVTVVCEPSDYDELLRELEARGGQTSPEFRARLAAKVFATTSRYDGAIAAYLQGLGQGASRNFSLHGELRQELRYGENPHQQAAFYRVPGAGGASIAQARQRSGKELSYNNILDLDAALGIVRDFPGGPCACVIKHNNPCGAALGSSLQLALRRAIEGDPLSAFGGVVGLNQVVDLATAEELAGPERFFEAIVAPEFAPEALELLTTRPRWGKNVRLLETGPLAAGRSPAPQQEIRWVSGGFLVQGRDQVADEWAGWKVATKRAPSAEESAALRFAQMVCKHVKSNAIVLAQGEQVVGVGAGQMSRVDSVEIAVKKAGGRAKGSVMASDAFFPFPDGVEAGARAGVTAVIQPGGSVKDQEVVAACDRLGLALVTTGIRHFRH